MNIAVVTWGMSPSGEPSFLLTEHVVTQEQYDEGVHYEMAEEEAVKMGFDDKPLVFIDENDAKSGDYEWLFVEARKTTEEWQARAWESQNC